MDTWSQPELHHRRDARKRDGFPRLTTSIAMMKLSTIMCALLLTACNKLDQATFTSPMVTKRVPMIDKLDILFVIDNSSSTVDKQNLFATNFTNLINALDAAPGGRPDLHIGVVSTTVDIGVGYGMLGPLGGCQSPDPSDDGLLQNTPRVPGCMPPTGQFIVDTEDATGVRTTNYSGTLSDAFSCIAELGDTGCGFEAPLEAMKRALDGSRPENAGFLRPEADLAVVILTDEDDCSVADSSLFLLPDDSVGHGDFRCQPFEAYDCDQPISLFEPGTYTGCKVRRQGYLHDPQEYVSFLATIKDPSQTMIGLIAGDPSTTIATGSVSIGGIVTDPALEPSCSTIISGNQAIGRPGIRLADFLSAYGDGNGVFQSVCQSDYSSVLSAFGASMSSMVGPCLSDKVATTDVDAHNPGLQLD
jgi:hypothetical protein